MVMSVGNIFFTFHYKSVKTWSFISAQLCLHGENLSLACYQVTQIKDLQHTFLLYTALGAENMIEQTAKATRIRLKWSLTMYEEVRYDQARSSVGKS